MQKIIRRVATAERVAAKRQKKKSLKSYKSDKKELTQQGQQHVKAAGSEVESAKEAIRNDWAMGSLAPRRDIGVWDGAHGAIGEARFSSPGHFSLVMRNARCQWAGGAYHLCLAAGDRVVLLDGPDKGRIGPVHSVNDDTAEVTISGLNKSNVRIMSHLRNNKDDAPAANIELPLPISAVRLVHPITDPSTGITRDTIINQLVATGLVTDRLTGKQRWQRVVPGLNIAIPWPVKKQPDLVDHKADTLRIDVEEKTFVPTLLRPPMHEAVIDELRNKYSRFRTRHDPEYVARIEAEAQAKKDRAKLIQSMRTPLQEFHRAERESKKRKGKPRLSIEMLEKIGEVIAKNQERTFKAAGLSHTLPPPPTTSNAESSPP